MITDDPANSGTEGNSRSGVITVNYNSSRGTIAHEVAHSLWLPDNGYNQGGVLSRPPERILQSEVDIILNNAYERKKN